MKIGDLVLKCGGDLDVGVSGVILEIITNDVGNTILLVSCEKGIRKWFSEIVEIINEVG